MRGFVVATVIGWGLVLVYYSDTYSFGGYLLDLIGGKDGDWAYANVGVLVALVLGFAVQYIGGRSSVVGQEERPEGAATPQR